MLQQHHGLLEWYTVKHPPAMGYKTVVFIQLSLALAAICHDSPNNRSSIVSPLHIFKSWIHHALPTEKTFWKKTLRNQALESFSKDLTSQTNSVNTETPEIVSSIKDSSDEDQDLSNFNQLFLTSFRSGCACQPSANGSCSTKCTSQESRCGRTCFHLTEYSASQIVQPARLDDENDFNVYSTYQTTLSSGCELLTRACIMTTALAAAAAAAAAVGVGVAIGVGVPMNGQALSNAVQQQQQAQVSQDVQRFLSSGGLFNSGIPRNDQPIPVRGASLSDGGCSDNLVLFPDGKCYPVLRRGPCGDPFRWVTVDPTSLTGRCSPRLCGRGRVFAGRDGLCHDVNDPLECRGGRRLYYSAYGDPLCDCPVGQYPFPTEDNDCVPLFTRGPCRDGQVVAFEVSGALACVPADCPSSPTQQLVRNENGQCFSLGSRDPCSSATQFYGYDVFQKRGVCIDTSDEDSPYFSGGERELDEFYNQIYPEYDDFRFVLIPSFIRMQKAKRRQDMGGVFRFPFSVPDTLLNPCRPGQRNGNNFKCSNPLVPRKRRSGLLQAVRSAFRCPAGDVLRANGFCVNDAESASCGPSYRFVSATGQCRQVVTR